MDELDSLLADLESSTLPLSRPPVSTDPNPIQVYKPHHPRSTERPAPAFSTSVLGGGLSELDNFLKELNATQFNISDEILAHFPPSSKVEEENMKDLQAEGGSRALEMLRDETAPPASTCSPVKSSATSATLELDKLMASLSDFRVQSALAPPVNQPVVSSRQPEALPSQAAPGGSLDSMLGLLQSNLSRQGVPVSTKRACSACKNPLVGQVVTALGQMWHPEHFVCAVCKSELSSCNFFEKDGKPYCEPDYFSLYSPHCGHCKKPILNKMVIALEKNWHPECFCCVHCGQGFGKEGFHDHEGQQFCKECFLSLFASRCQGCSRPILDNYISALSSLWHPECFVCRECYTPFVSGSFFEHEGQPLCEVHYHRCRGSVCSACQQPILGRCVTAMGAKFHPDHLVCHFCLAPLSKGCFIEQEDKPYCHNCFNKLFG